MTTEEREDASVARGERVCERCGDFGALRVVNARGLCAGCVERLPEVIRTPLSLGGLLRGAAWTISRSAKHALPIAFAYGVLEVTLPWVLGVDTSKLAMVVGALLQPVAQLMLLSVFRATLYDEPVTLGAAGRLATDRYLSLLTTGLYSGLIIGLAALAFIVPGLVFATRYFIAPAMVAFEGKSGGAALERSKTYIDGVAWPVAGAMAVVFFPPLLLNVGTAVGYEIYAPGTSMTPAGAAVLIPSGVVSSMAILLGLGALIVVVYANRRFHADDEASGAPAPYPASSARATPAP